MSTDNTDIAFVCRLYAISAKDATLLARLDIQGGINCDWEDLAVGPGPIAGHSYIYIADTGGRPSRKPCR